MPETRELLESESSSRTPKPDDGHAGCGPGAQESVHHCADPGWSRRALPLGWPPIVHTKNTPTGIVDFSTEARHRPDGELLWTGCPFNSPQCNPENQRGSTSARPACAEPASAEGPGAGNASQKVGPPQGACPHFRQQEDRKNLARITRRPRNSKTSSDD